MRPKATKSAELHDTMIFRIADTFTDSLARLTREEQKAAKTTAFDLQLDPVNPGMQFHRLDRAKDKNFWSVRVGSDIRLIVHRSGDSLLLCYVDHHDKAYAWAERRRLETHPSTGAAQLVEIRETVREISVPARVADSASGMPLSTGSVLRPLSGFDDKHLLRLGVPAEWLNDVREADEDGILSIAVHLPAEAAEALLNIAVARQSGGALPAMVASKAVDLSSLHAASAMLVGQDDLMFAALGSTSEHEPVLPLDPFDHPDARRRFRRIDEADELRAALESPWDKWTIFLHPEQRDWVERNFSGPSRVSGSAGTGKTIVALHRAAHLARTNVDARILLTTYSDTLVSALRTRLKRLLASEPRLGERIDVHSLEAIAERLYRALVGPVDLAQPEVIRTLLQKAASEVPDHRFSPRFLRAEWDQVVDAWQLASWDDYRSVTRLGRKTRLAETQRKALWAIFDRVRLALGEQKLTTPSAMYSALAASFVEGRKPAFDHVVVDEAQDLTVAQLRFLGALAGDRPNSLFFAGDLGQRIFQQPFSWKSLGVDVRGRSKTLRVNYRTSHQIRSQADRLLEAEIADVDGNVERRSDTVSVFNGPAPAVKTFTSEQEEIEGVAQWIGDRLQEGAQAHELGLFVRSGEQLGRAKAAAAASGAPYKVLDEQVESASGSLSIATMHLAKGLEFRAVAVMACDDEVIPFQARIDEVGDQADLKDVYDTERQLLYVACTRARDNLLVSAVKPASEFLEDFLVKPGEDH